MSNTRKLRKIDGSGKLAREHARPLPRGRYARWVYGQAISRPDGLTWLQRQLEAAQRKAAADGAA